MESTSLPAPTATDLLWFNWLQELGCIACLIQTSGRHPHTEAEIHHLLEGGRRVSHRRSLALCPWHHRGVRPGCLSHQSVRRRRGPSLALEPAEFQNKYGTDDDLFQFQCKALALYLLAVYRGDVMRTLGLETYLPQKESP